MFNTGQNKVGFIQEGFELNKPLDGETYEKIQEKYSEDWIATEDKKWIIGNYLDEHYKPEESLKELIESVLSPKGYVLNGEAFAEEEYYGGERGRKVWYYIVTNNELKVKNNIEIEEERVIADLKKAEGKERDEVFAKFFYRIGYHNIGAYLRENKKEK